jgi:hypothetical protein
MAMEWAWGVTTRGLSFDGQGRTHVLVLTLTTVLHKLYHVRTPPHSLPHQCHQDLFPYIEHTCPTIYSAGTAQVASLLPIPT